MTHVIAIFDIGKTNKKLLLFDNWLNLVYQEETKIQEIYDDDGFSCDNIFAVEDWIKKTLTELVHRKDFSVKGLNFTTYGASLVYLDKAGNRLTPVYNYLKPMPDGVLSGFYERFGGINEFCRKTASPALGMLNSGLQILWLKKTKPLVYEKVSNILHFPQYLSYLFTGQITSEFTSIGCHTAMWDFDMMKYHEWLNKENIRLPEPLSNKTTFNADIDGNFIPTGIGIHDSSSSLVPYLTAINDPFILISTGTWCIFMNPFNSEPLTLEQLKNDSLCYLSAQQKQVKSSRLFMGHIHDVNSERIAEHFSVSKDFYKAVNTNESFITEMLHNEKKVFFTSGLSGDYIDRSVDLNQFQSSDEAYHQLIFDLTKLALKSLRLIIPQNDNTTSVFISGGFCRNDIFTRLLATLVPNKIFYTTEIDNATALGAAMVIWEKIYNKPEPLVNLGLKKIKPISGF
jgi:sugar (pentulose or hexulose) kinase